MPLTGPAGLMVPPGIAFDPKLAVPGASGIVSWPAPPRALLETVKTLLTNVAVVNGMRAGKLGSTKPSVVPLPLVLLKIPAKVTLTGGGGGGGGGGDGGGDDGDTGVWACDRLC